MSIYMYITVLVYTMPNKFKEQGGVSKMSIID